MTMETKTDERVTQEFLGKLRTLLAEYGATLEAKDHYQGYPECGEDIRMTVSILGVYADGERVRPYVEIDLGRSFK